MARLTVTTTTTSATKAVRIHAGTPTAARLLVLIRALTFTEFRLRYAGSIFGYFWSLARPLLLFGVLYVAFARVLKFGAGVDNYPLLLLVALVLWSYFLETTSAAMGVLVARADVLRKIAIPLIVLPVSVSLTALLGLLLNLVAIAVFLFVGGITPTFAWLWFPLLLLELYAFTLGVSLILSALFVPFRDMGDIWSVLSQTIFYGTPIIYPVTLVVGLAPGWVTPIMCNPMAQIIYQSQSVLIGGHRPITEFLEGWWIAVPYLVVAITFIGGLLLYRHRSASLTERL
jgi:ABC-2 type transport system permease protein